MSPRAILVPLALALAVLAAASARGSPASAGRCFAGGEQTTVVIDGELYGMIRSRTRPSRYVFGWSGEPVLSIGDALRLLRKLGLRGSDRALLRLGDDDHAIPGADYGEGGSIAYFTLRCRGAYSATVVVRGGRFLPATRIWLHEEHGTRVLRAFCMSGQWLPNDARLSVAFTVPLAKTPPAFTIDRDGDGRIDRRGSLRRGGARFPSSERC